MPDSIQEMDFHILGWIQTHLRCASLDWIMPKITCLGNAGIFWILLTAAFLVYGALRSRHALGRGLAMLSGLTAGLVLWTFLMKNLVARARPCWIDPSVQMLIAIPRDYSFPSGHSLASFTCAAILLRHDRRWGIPATLLAAAIAFSRLYLYVHFPTDVLAGTALGILTGILADILVGRVFLMEPDSNALDLGG